MTQSAPSSTPGPAVASGTLREVAGIFFKLGYTAFGGPAAHIAMMRQELVQRRGWLSDQRFMDLLGVVNLIPGPNSTQLAMYLGYVRAGWVGLLVAGACFIGPAMLIVLALAWIYVRFGSAPQTSWLLYGLQPVVIAIVLQALLGLGRTALRGPLRLLVVCVALALYLLGGNPLVILFGAGLIYALLQVPGMRRGASSTPAAAGEREQQHEPERAPRAPTTRSVAPAALAAGGAAAALPVSLMTLFLTFLKIGAVLYGSGYVLLAFLRADFVQHLGWLSDRQLLDAVAVGQVTPGPVFTTATFVGYLVGGWQGALLATVGIFLPSFAYVSIIHRLAAALRRSPWTASVLDGVNVAALALMAGVTLQLARHALIDPLTWALALVSLATLLRLRLNSVWLLLGGAAVGLLSHALA